MIRLDKSLLIPEEEISLSFVRASGPGGQNVNKVATAAQLRFDVNASRSLSPAVKDRLKRLAGRRVGQDGVLTIRAYRFRTQERNRDDAIERLNGLISEALNPPKPRLKTKVPRSVKRLRLEGKQRRANVKATRRPPSMED